MGSHKRRRSSPSNIRLGSRREGHIRYNEPTAWFGGMDLDDEGGNGGQGAVDRPERKLSQEPERSLERPKTAPERDQEPDIGDDDPAEDAGERHLDLIRRVAGLDRDDPDLLPDF